LFNGFYANFDNVILNEDSPWFSSVGRNTMLREAIDRGLRTEPCEYGDTRKFDFNNIFLGGKLPSFLGFDIRGKTLPGSRATIPQGQMFKNAGRLTTFSPSFRMIVEMEKDEMQTNIAGGPSGRRFSRWYGTGIKEWEDGIYKKLKPPAV
jgi:penicillin amidase